MISKTGLYCPAVRDRRRQVRRGCLNDPANGAYRLPSATTLQFIAAARRLGTAGVILFSYDALTAPPYTATTVTDIGRAAFGAGSY